MDKTRAAYLAGESVKNRYLVAYPADAARYSGSVVCRSLSSARRQSTIHNGHIWLLVPESPEHSAYYIRLRYDGESTGDMRSALLATAM